jgi:hypothetical protein
MAAGFDPLKKLFGGGGGGLFGPTGPQAISAASAAGARNNPAYNVATQTMMSQPYPDKILRDSTKLGGIKAWEKAKEMVGEPTEFEYLTKELDRDFIQEAMASALGGAPELPGSGPRPPSGSQPQPGDFATLIPSPSPLRKKKRYAT